MIKPALQTAIAHIHYTGRRKESAAHLMCEPKPVRQSGKYSLRSFFPVGTLSTMSPPKRRIVCITTKWARAQQGVLSMTCEQDRAHCPQTMVSTPPGVCVKA